MKYLLSQLDKLKGGIIQYPVWAYGGAEEPSFAGLLIAFPHGKEKILWIQSDEEGNDIGWAEVEED